MRDRHCTADTFAASLTSLVGDSLNACDERAGKAVEQSARRGAKLLRGKYTDGIGKHPWSKEYRSGFGTHFERSSGMATAEIGNRNKPGLVHLLEKGHLTLTGRRTSRFRHMEPASADIFEDCIARVEKAVGEALEG